MGNVMQLEGFKHDHNELEGSIPEFVNQVRRCSDLPLRDRPTMDSWNSDLIQSLRRCALRDRSSAQPDGSSAQPDDDGFIAEWICQKMGNTELASTHGVKLLRDTGHFCLHENVELLRSRFYPYDDDDDEVSNEVNRLCNLKDMEDGCSQIDLTERCAYAIDPDDPHEIDDALSVARLEDGRIKVWIHIVDASSVVGLNTCIDSGARKRGQTLYLPCSTSYVFPKKIEMERMSFRNGHSCKAVTVSTILNEDGSFDRVDYQVVRSTIKVKMLTYDQVDQILKSFLSEEASDLRLLLDAAKARSEWRRKHVSTDYDDEYNTSGYRPGRQFKSINVKVSYLDAEPCIKFSKECGDENKSPASLMVDEMMFLCCHVIAWFGACNGIRLPYRGPGYFTSQREPRADLGLLEGYVQFTSPIRRYMDFIVHHQVTSCIKKMPHLSCEQLDDLGKNLGDDCEDAANILIDKRKKYWIIEAFRRSKVEMKKFEAKVVKTKRIDNLYGYDCKYRGSMLVNYENIFEYFTIIEDIPMEVHWRGCKSVCVKVKEADPHSGTLTFKMS